MPESREKDKKKVSGSKLEKELVRIKEERNLFKQYMDIALNIMLVVDPDHKITFINKKGCQIFGYSETEILGQDYYELLVPPSRRKKSSREFDEVIAGKIDIAESYEGTLVDRSGNERLVYWHDTLLRDKGGRVTGMLSSGEDITDKRKMEQKIKQAADELRISNNDLKKEVEERKRAESIIRKQSNEILEMSTPVMQIWDGVLVAPLIGTLDSQRTQQFMEMVLNRIVETNSTVAIVDIMGVPSVDTQTAQHLLETISAIQLLGASAILTGLRPAIAQTLIHLGIDLNELTTCSSLSTGLRIALERLQVSFGNSDSEG